MNNMKGLNPKAYLAKHLFTDKVEQSPTRQGYGEGLVVAGEKDEAVVVLCADLTESTKSFLFKTAFPARFVQMGVSEQSMASIAAGFAMAGKVPFISSYAAFSPGRNWEQIRTTIALNGLNVKIGGAHAGISVGPDGATHQPIEDVATMRVMPRMTVVVPCDAIEAKKATIAAAAFVGPLYLRFAREKTPVFTTAKTPFKLGRAEIFRLGGDVTIIGTGTLLYEALRAALSLSKEGIEVRVLNIHTIKPLDEKAIVTAAKQTGAIVTIEEANIIGGLGGAVCETVAAHSPVPVERVGVQDHFGESGDPAVLMEAFGLTAETIVAAVHRVLDRKQGKAVPTIPTYLASIKTKAEKMRKATMELPLTGVPKKWGGKMEEAKLKSRREQGGKA